VCVFVCAFVDMHVADVRVFKCVGAHRPIYACIYVCMHVPMYTHLYIINIYLNKFGDFNERAYILFQS
jgi:hypothetical protein